MARKARKFPKMPKSKNLDVLERYEKRCKEIAEWNKKNVYEPKKKAEAVKERIRKLKMKP